jgi:hypothetical protein
LLQSCSIMLVDDGLIKNKARDINKIEEKWERKLWRLDLDLNSGVVNHENSYALAFIWCANDVG